MVISVFPSSAFALKHADGTEYTEGNGYTYGSAEFTNPTDIWCDTTETTEILRLAESNSEGAGLFRYGNVLVKATPSGIPETASAFKSYLYAGEAVYTPKIVCKIYGIENNDPNKIQSFNFAERSGDGNYATKLSNVSYSNLIKKAVTVDANDSSKNYIELSCDITYASTSTATGPNKDVNFLVTFKYQDKTYNEYAYSHTEYILHPNGLQLYGWTRNLTSTNGRMSVLATILGANMKPGYAKAYSSSTTRAYVNGTYTTDTTDDGKTAVTGMTENGPENSDSSFVRKSSNDTDENNSLLYSKLSRTKNYSGTCCHFQTYSTAVDSNRVMSTVWIDKATDYIGSNGYSSSGKTNNLNMRVVFKVGTVRLFWYGYLYRFQLHGHSGNSVGKTGNSGTDDSWTSGDSTSTSNDVNAVNTNQWTADLTYKSSNGSSNVSNLVEKGRTAEGDCGWLQDGDVSATSSRGYTMVNLGGVGPTSSQTGISYNSSSSDQNSWSLSWGYMGKFDDPNNMTTSNYASGNRGVVSGNMSVRFRVYDTSVLRQLITAIDKGTAGESLTSLTWGGTYGSNFSSKTASITASKGANPQEAMYAIYTTDAQGNRVVASDGGWANFKAAYDTARQLIAAFDVDTTFHSFQGVDKESGNSAGLEQSNIDNAINNLITYYNALQYKKNGTITIHHYIRGTTTKAAPDEVYYGFDANGNPTKVEANVATPFNTGVTFKINPLSTITGYKATSTNQIEGYAGFAANGATTLYHGTDVISGSDGAYVFEYEVAEQNLKIHPNNDYTGGILVESVKTGAVPAFESYKSSFGTKAHYNFEGYYESNDFSTAKIDESTWTMPPTDTDVYVKWAPKPVKLHVNAVDDSNNAITLSAGEYSEGVAPTETDGTLSGVSFNQISNPTAAEEGYTFMSFYSDAACTNVITWPLEANYNAEEEKVYTIVEGTGDYNTIEIYAKFANINNKISFEANGGTMPTGYETNQITFETGTAISYPTPTKAGYTFSGWVTENGAPINADSISGATGSWAEIDTSTEAGIKPTEGGTITMSSTAGFVAYAKWTTNDLVGRFDIGVSGKEDSFINYNADSYKDINVKADQLSSKDDEPSIPRRYGYTFAYWKVNGRQFKFGETKYPTSNDRGKDYFVIEAIWNETKTVAHTDLVSYVKYAGEQKTVDDQHTKATDIEAACGDVISVKFTVSGNFYSGSQGYIFGYDTDFYEEVQNVNVFTVNKDNSFIKATGSGLTVVEAFSSSVQSMFTNKDPETGDTNVKYIQVYVEPDIGTSKVTQSMADQNYLIEIRLKIKDKASIGADRGSVWLATETYRTSSNIMGDTFISYTNTSKSYRYVATDTVTLDTAPIVSTVTVNKELVKPDTTITLTLPQDSDGNYLGAFTDSQNSTTMTFTGREGAEILTYDDNGNVAQGFPTPVREGYTIEKWVLVDNGTTDETNTWTEGYYATAEQNGKTYQAVWKANSYTYTFYDSDKTTNYGEVEVVYDQVGVKAVTYSVGAPATATKEFIGWIAYDETTGEWKEANKDNVYDFENAVVKGDMKFYAYTIPAQKNVTINYFIYNVSTGTYGTKAFATYSLTTGSRGTQIEKGVEYRVGDLIKVVENVPETTEDAVKYITYSDLLSYEAQDSSKKDVDLSNYEYYTGQQPVEMGVVARQNSNVINVYVIGKEVTETFTTIYTGNTSFGYQPYKQTSSSTREYVGATYSGNYTATTSTTDNGATAYTWTITGRYGESYDADSAIAGVTAPFGYTISWRVGTTTKEMGTFAGYSWNVYYTTVKINPKYVDKDAQTILTPASSATAALNYHNGNISVTKLKAATTASTAETGFEIDGFYAVKYNETTKLYEKVSDTVYSNTQALYMGSVAENEFTVTTTETTDESGNVTGTTTTYDLYLMPHYSAIKYDIKYIAVYSDDAAGSKQTNIATKNAVLNGTFKVGDEVEIPAVTGYSIRKTGEATAWYTSSDLSGTAIANGTEATLTSTEGVTYYAVYDPIEYAVTFDANGGAFNAGTTSAVNVKFNAQITAPAENPTWEGHEFKGWAAISTDKTPLAALPTLTTTEPVTYYAVWSYSVTFNANGGVLVDASGNKVESIKTTYLLGETITAPAAPTKTGYTFDGWDKTVATTMPANNLVYTAQWKVNTYTIHFGDNDAYGKATAEYNADITAAIEAANNAAAKDGYVLTGWTPTNFAKTDDKYLMPALGDDGTSITVYPAYTEITYTVEFNHNGGTGTSEPATVKYDAALTLPTLTPANEGKTGYSFAGWSKSNNATVAEYKAGTLENANLTAVNGDTVTLYAVWTANDYSIRFIEATEPDEKEFATITKAFGESVADELAAVGAPTKDGYTFAGWSTSANAATADFKTAAEIKINDNNTMPYNGKAYYAVWTVNAYKITEILGVENEKDPYDVNYGTDLSTVLTAAPTKDGYNFAGTWVYTKTDDSAVTYSGATMPDYDLTATANWTAHNYTVNINLNSATSIEADVKQTVSVEYAPGVTVTLPVAETDFARADYRFTGWYPTEEDAENGTNKLDITDNTYVVLPQSEDNTVINVWAGWEYDYFTLTFNPNGGNFDSTVDPSKITAEGNYATQVIYNHDITAEVPADPTKDGYDFKGWYDSTGTKTPAMVSKMTRSDLTFTASWAEHEYKNGVKFIQPDSSNLADDYTDILSYTDVNTYKKANGDDWTVTAKTGEGLSEYPENVPEVGDWTFMYWVVSDTAPTYSYNENIDDYVYNENGGAKYTVSGTYVDKEGNTQTVTSLADFVMPAIDNDSTLYFWAVYYRDDVELTVQSNSKAVIDKDENEELGITGFIYNVGEMQKQADIEAQLEVLGDGSLKLTPSKDDLYGSGAKVELVDNRQGKTDIVETYYIVVFGDVTGTARLTATDISAIKFMNGIEEGSRTWYIRETVSELTDAEKAVVECYDRAADADHDGDIDTTDAYMARGVLFGTYELKYVPATETEKGYYLATPIAKTST